MNASPTRLLHITTVPFSLFFFRGQPRFMRSKGVDFRILTSPGEELDEFVRREEVDVYPIPMERRITPFKDLAAVLRIARTIRGLRPDIVHAHTPKGGLLGMIAAWLTRVPVRIYHIRGLPYTIATGRKRALMMWTERISCMLAHDVLCVSHSIREIAVRDGICPPDKVKVLLGGSGNGVDAAEQFHPDRFQADDRNSVREKLGIAPDNLVVSYIGRIVKDKGIDELASAWRVIRDRFRDAHLVLVGPVEPQDPVSPELLAQLQSDNRVHFLPRVEDPAPYYAISDLVVLPTYRERFPNVPLEAAAMAIPVVTTDVPGCIDAVKNGITGTLVPTRDADALQTAITRYLDDPELRRQHGEAGRQRVLREFAQERIWNALYDEYVRLLKGRGIMGTSSDQLAAG